MLLRYIVPAFLMFFLIMESGCQKNCSHTVCHTYETCNAAVCYCPNGYEGDSCNIYSFTKFINLTFLTSDNCSGQSSYYVTFSYDPSHANRLYINNMFGNGQQMEADILSSADKKGVNLYVPEQTFGAAIVSGQGLYELYGGRAKITFTMTYNNSGIDRSCTIILNQW